MQDYGLQVFTPCARKKPEKKKPENKVSIQHYIQCIFYEMWDLTSRTQMPKAVQVARMIIGKDSLSEMQ